MKNQTIINGLMATVLCSAVVGAEEPVVKKLETTPTRLMTGDLSENLSALRAKLAINTKDVGPFGLFQQPGKEPAKPLLPSRPKLQKRAEVPFSTVIEALPVAAVMADEKMFMVGSRSIKVGQVLPLIAAGKTIKVRVESVGNSQIVFRNLTTNELAVKRLDLLPDGVSSGGGSIRPPGVTATNDGIAEPLTIDLGLPPAPLEE